MDDSWRPCKVPSSVRCITGVESDEMNDVWGRAGSNDPRSLQGCANVLGGLDMRHNVCVYLHIFRFANSGMFAMPAEFVSLLAYTIYGVWYLVQTQAVTLPHVIPRFHHYISSKSPHFGSN